MASVKDIDRGFRDLLRRFSGIVKPKIEVGIFEQDGNRQHGSDELTVLEVAIANEFGTDSIPERSFVRAWFDENQGKCREAIRRMTIAVAAGKYTKEQAYELVAQRFVGEIQRRMAQGIPPPNAETTIKLKGSDKPLIDTGQLRSSITYRVSGVYHPSKNATRIRKSEKKQRERTAKQRVRNAKRARKQAAKATKRAFKKAIRDTKRTIGKTKRSFLKNAKKVARAIRRSKRSKP